MAGNRFEELMDMSEDVTDKPRTKRTINDRSPESNVDDRAAKLKKLNLMEVFRKAEKDMDSLKDDLALANTKLDEKTSWKDAKVIFMTLFDSVVDSIESNVTVMTDVTAAVDRYETVIAEKDRKIEKLVERIGELEARKDSQEAKASQADRKEIIDGAAKDMNTKIRSDVKEKWTEATRMAKVIPVGRKTGKRTVDRKEINTVPVLIRIEDKDSRWKAEEALRQSKIHPAFHWPQGMLGHVKKFRQLQGLLRQTITLG
jgi:prefoldin subunit 5